MRRMTTYNFKGSDEPPLRMLRWIRLDSIEDRIKERNRRNWKYQFVLFVFFMETPEASTPIFTLTVEKFEPLFKGWIKEVLASEKSEEPTNVFYSRYDISKLLRISLPTLSRYISLGIITGHRVGNRILFSQDDIDKALREIKKAWVIRTQITCDNGKRCKKWLHAFKTVVWLCRW